MRSLSRRRDLADHLMLGDLEGAHLPAPEAAMLRYALKLTRHSHAVTPMDISDLRDAGFSDAAIADIALNTALFAAWNRIVDGLGGTLLPGMMEEARRLHLPQAWAAQRPDPDGPDSGDFPGFGGGPGGGPGDRPGDGPDEGGTLATIF